MTGDVATLENAVDDFVGSAIDLVTGVKRVFVTSTMVAADFAFVSNDGALAGDTICLQHADAAGLGGSWKAWLSDQATSPSVRFARSNGPYQREEPRIHSWCMRRHRAAVLLRATRRRIAARRARPTT